VVYVDNDPLVMVHARALLTGTPQGRTAYLEGDLRDPDKIMNSAEVRSTLDLDRPVAVLLVAVLHFILDDEDAYGLVSRLTGAVAPGSYLVLSNATTEFMSPDQRAMFDAANAAAKRREDRGRLRSRAEIEQFFDGLELVPPGLCTPPDWRPTEPSGLGPADVNAFGAVARIG
jgi:hypothetical protein